MADFKTIQQILLDEMMRLKGLGDAMHNPKCAICQALLDPAAVEPGEPESQMREKDASDKDRRIFKCPDCGEFLQCRSCCRDRHSMTPLHFLKVSSIDFWILDFY